MVEYDAQEQSKPDGAQVNRGPQVNVMRSLRTKESIDVNIAVLGGCIWKTIEPHAKDGVMFEGLQTGGPYIETPGATIFKGRLESVGKSPGFRDRHPGNDRTHDGQGQYHPPA
jgi:hypothetical protein